VVQRLRRFAFRGDMTAVPLDLNAAAREALALTEAEARARQVMVQAQLAESLPPVLASDIHMQQVIYNMVHNAILAAAAQDQTGQVTLRTHADGGRVWLEVLDNAATPDESDHEAGGAAKSGIGLALSRSIVTSYDGDLTSQRLETGGNRIALSLPMIST
jgi:C4-dicarboxylate-specific signal transduction histidine kinase